MMGVGSTPENQFRNANPSIQMKGVYPGNIGRKEEISVIAGDICPDCID